MTKNQIKVEALSLAVTHKANKALTKALTELFEEYAKTGKLDSVKREKLITINKVNYQWCNRHEVYELTTNFKNEKSPECKLATKYWSYLGTKVKDIQTKLDATIEAEKYDEIKAIKHELDDAKALRGGRYDFDANSLQFAEIADYSYDKELLMSDEELSNSKA